MIGLSGKKVGRFSHFHKLKGRDFLSKDKKDHPLQLKDGSRVAVIGGGPAGAFFSYFLLRMADMVDIKPEVVIYESRDFNHPGPIGCNMCGGIISESLVQTLVTDGIDLPPTVVQRSIDSYIFHMDQNHARIDTPIHEKRIGAVYRGSGPKTNNDTDLVSFDGYILEKAVEKGALLKNDRITGLEWEDGKPVLSSKNGDRETYDLLAVAVGVNSATLKLFEPMEFGFTPPETTKTIICEYFLGQEVVEKYLGSSMHPFLLDIPGLEFAALIPKGEYVTVCVLGTNKDGDIFKDFITHPEVGRCFPPDWDWKDKDCQCTPQMNIRGTPRPFHDRLVFVGDCGISRLYKDGIGAAYRTAKSAVSTSLFEGISSADFIRHSWPHFRLIERDNRIGKLIFTVIGKIQNLSFLRRAILRMVTKEQAKDRGRQDMSLILWDLFTGSASYSEILTLMLHPLFLMKFIGNIFLSFKPSKKRS
jgi:flavin-dependent dehydrogenase